MTCPLLSAIVMQWVQALPRPFKDDLPSLNEQLAHQPPSNSFHGPRQSMRDLQDSEELEKLFKPYAFKNKVLMVKKMGAVLHKSFETWVDVR